ncbi:hypothetical protein JRG66_14255 [Salinimicrobium tongyeongense]|jgi:hypothetical protein|uniref:DNA primase n=1 Tax=Salinimicrobium tongyeongense TaxID=2809707 RepID=A0ABY6NQC0_9FLAO|nr:hypothetical protein [Salinimicrobium tongyeongense]UZH55101.1 hypothetical protein JRG66_14255 [Salinimicrobium tongyeongense]
MKRIIVDYKKLTPEILGLLVEKYPDGYDDDQIISFKNAKNETVEAVEVRTEDSIYLVKVSTRLENTMANYDEEDYDDSDFNEPIVDLPEKNEDVEEDMDDMDDAEEDEDPEDL